MKKNTWQDQVASLMANRVTEAIILAGGLGTRLHHLTAGIPKVLAPVNGKPFLSYVIDYLRMQGVTRFIFSLGYKADAIEHYLKETYPVLDYATVTEDEPAGTGGGIRLALQKAKTGQVLIVNGDTLFKVDLSALYQKQMHTDAECTVALKSMTDTGRFGTVTLDARDAIVAFKEKGTTSEGIINGGIYLLNKSRFFARSFPAKFSFEKEYLEKYTGEKVFSACRQDGYFIDIGVPPDFTKAQSDFVMPTLNLSIVDKSWTLFIDRDGVINDEKVGEYILDWKQFVFSEGVLNSFKKLTNLFGRLLIVTNQKGVGKGLMTKASLDDIHTWMQKEIEDAGGSIAKIYACTDIENNSFFRKPNPGMAWLAKKDFPEIDFSKSIMVGNKPSDMRFGRAAGMYTVFLSTTNPEEPYPHPDVDLRFSSLAEFTAALR